MALTAAEIHQRGYEPEQLESRLRLARCAGNGSEYASAVGIIRGTMYTTRDPAERLMLIDRILDALERVTASEWTGS